MPPELEENRKGRGGEIVLPTWRKNSIIQNFQLTVLVMSKLSGVQEEFDVEVRVFPIPPPGPDPNSFAVAVGAGEDDCMRGSEVKLEVGDVLSENNCVVRVPFPDNKLVGLIGRVELVHAVDILRRDDVAFLDAEAVEVFEVEALHEPCKAG